MLTEWVGSLIDVILLSRHHIGVVRNVIVNHYVYHFPLVTIC